MVATLPASDAMSAAAAGNIIPPRAGRRNRRPDDGTARYFAGRLPRLTMPECPARPEYPERSRRSFEAVSRLEGKYAGRATRRLARRAGGATIYGTMLDLGRRSPIGRRATGHARNRCPRVNRALTVVIASWPDSRQRRRAMRRGGTLPRDPATSEFIPAPKQGATLQALLVLSCLIPVVVLALAGWRSWQFERARTAQRARTTLGLVEEHVRKVLDTQVLVLDWLCDRMSGSGWRDIERSRS